MERVLLIFLTIIPRVLFVQCKYNVRTEYCVCWLIQHSLCTGTITRPSLCTGTTTRPSAPLPFSRYSWRSLWICGRRCTSQPLCRAGRIWWSDIPGFQDFKTKKNYLATIYNFVGYMQLYLPISCWQFGFNAINVDFV